MKKRAGSRARVVSLTLAAIGCGDPLGGADDGGVDSVPDAGRPSAVCGSVRDWDSDGDGLSDRVEENNGSNGYVDLRTGRCDEDPSVAEGSPNAGALTSGLNLPDRNTGYAHFYGTDAVDSDDWGVGALVGCVEATGRRLASTDILVQVGDMSLRHGGTFPPHVAHQNGLEADFRYVRTDRASVPLDLRVEPDAFDEDATRQLFDAMFDECDVDFILVDDRVELDLSPVRQTRVFFSDGHANHFHLRIRNPRP